MPKIAVDTFPGLALASFELSHPLGHGSPTAALACPPPPLCFQTPGGGSRRWRLRLCAPPVLMEGFPRYLSPTWGPEVPHSMHPPPMVPNFRASPVWAPHSGHPGLGHPLRAPHPRSLTEGTPRQGRTAGGTPPTSPTSGHPAQGTQVTARLAHAPIRAGGRRSPACRFQVLQCQCTHRTLGQRSERRAPCRPSLPCCSASASTKLMQQPKAQCAPGN